MKILHYQFVHPNRYFFTAFRKLRGQPSRWLQRSADSCRSQSSHQRHGNHPTPPRSGRLHHSYQYVSVVHLKEISNVHSAPSVFACSSINGSFHARRPSMIPISISAWVVKPVILLPEMIGLPVFESRMSVKIAGPWQLMSC